MKNNSKWVNIAYIESVKSKKWMDKHLAPQGKSAFIRQAVRDQIELSTVSKKQRIAGIDL